MTAALTRLKPVWNDRSILLISKIPLMHPLASFCILAWSCVPFIRFGQNHLARHSEKGKKTRQTVEEVERKH